MIDQQQLTQFYTESRGSFGSIYDAWEREIPFGVWGTPAVTDLAYRSYLAGLIAGRIADRPQPRILSVGCGNGFVEGVLVEAGIRVDGVDLHERGVQLARRRGVRAAVGDITQWTPPQPKYDLILADGVLGHLYDPDAPVLTTALTRLRDWLADHGTIIVANDLCDEVDRVLHSPTGIQFYRFSSSFLEDTLRAAGLFRTFAEVYVCAQPGSEEKKERLIAAAAKKASGGGSARGV